jgi:hypothetical protein
MTTNRKDLTNQQRSIRLILKIRCHIQRPSSNSTHHNGNNIQGGDCPISNNVLLKARGLLKLRRHEQFFQRLDQLRQLCRAGQALGNQNEGVSVIEFDYGQIGHGGDGVG